MNKGFSEEKKMAVRIFGIRLHNLATENSISAYRLSAELKKHFGVSSGFDDNLISSKWFRGVYKPPYDVIKALAQILNCEFKFLYIEEGDIIDTIQMIKLGYWKSGKTFATEEEFARWVSSKYGFCISESRIYIQNWVLQRLISGESTYNKNKEKERIKEFEEYEKKYQAFADSTPSCLFENAEGIDKNRDSFNQYMRFCIDTITRYYFGEITKKECQAKIAKENFFNNEIPNSLIQAWEDEVKYGKHNKEGK